MTSVSRENQCPHSGQKQTSQLDGVTSAFDPNQTSARPLAQLYGAEPGMISIICSIEMASYRGLNNLEATHGFAPALSECGLGGLWLRNVWWARDKYIRS